MTNSPSGRPIVVVGAGVVGLCTAYYLRQAGAEVTVVEGSAVGSGASWGNAGWVCRSLSVPVPAPGVIRHVARTLGRPHSPVYLRPELSLAFARWMWQFWRSSSAGRFAASARALTAFAAPVAEQFAEIEAAGVDTSVTWPGLLHAFLSASEAERTLSTQRAFSDGVYSVPAETLRGSRARALDSALGPAVTAGYVIDGEGLVNPEVFTTSLAKWLTEQGVPVVEQSRVVGFRVQAGRVVGVRLLDREIDCASVVVAAGTRSVELTRGLGLRLPMQAGKGYSFLVSLPVPPRRPMYLGDKHIVASPIGTLTRLAGTMEFSGNNLRLDWRRIVSIAQASRSYLGDWFDSPDELMGRISHPWVGGRPMLPDGLPVIDAVPGVANAYLSTGHGMLGVALSTASGKSLSGFILTGRRPPELEPFQLSRLPGIHAADGVPRDRHTAGPA